MQRFFSLIRQAFHKNVVILGLISLLSVSGLFIFAQQSALAVSNKPLNPSSQAQEAIDRAYTFSEAAGLKEEDRQTAYEEATKAINEPGGKGIEKIYEEDLEAYEKTQPDKGLVEGAKELLENVTGND